MDSLIQDILEIVDDYGVDNIFDQNIDFESVYNWAIQFKEEDREFLLTELKFLLPKCYLSKETVIDKLTSVFEKLRTDFNYDTVDGFLDDVYFLDCQDEEKSQDILLELVDDILEEEYDRSIDDCGTGRIRYWIYLDDILASGGTYRHDLIDAIENYGEDEFLASDIKVIGIFFIVHTWGLENSKYALSRTFGNEIKEKLRFYKSKRVGNYPHINYYHPNPKFNHIYPIESDRGLEFLEFIETAFEHNYPLKHEKLAFRKSSYPLKESFFSCEENRNRYEEILLEKGIEIINSIDQLSAKSIRPLGMTPPHFKTLGTGTHYFTWRNISNTCPLVFWWGTIGGNGWNPLFPVHNRGRH